MSDPIAVIQDKINVRSIAVAIAADPGSTAIENVADVMSLVDDQGVATAIGTGSGSGTVTSVAATASGLLAVAGTPTVAPTVGMATAAAHTTIGNPTGSTAVPKAMSRTELTAELNAATASLPGAMTAAQFTLLTNAFLSRGPDLNDADQTITPAVDGFGEYHIPATVTGSHNYTTAATSAIQGDQVRYVNYSAFTQQIKNGAGTNLILLPAVTANAAKAADLYLQTNQWIFSVAWFMKP